MTVSIRGGTVVDGTGAPPARADVVLEGARVAGIGPGAGGADADTVIDATGMVVAPGFVDLHTHYDAQLFWDPNASPSPLHGVTTVLGGNCGFSLAPMAPEHVDYISRMMARVEGMPLAALRAGVPWDWSSFGDWLGQLEGRIAVNAGFLVGHSTLRRLVMGERAVGGAATAHDIDAMEAALHAALAEGALGFSTSQVHTHNDGDGQPVPSRAASRPEMERLAAAVREHEGTTVELIVAGCLDGFSAEDIDFLATMSLLADRPVNWNVLGVSAMNAAGAWSQLEAGSAAAARGATVLALTLPHTMQLRLSFENGAILDGLPGWREIFALPLPERVEALSTPRPVIGSTPARSRTRRASSGTSRCGSASSSTRPSLRKMPAPRAGAWGRWRATRRGALRCPARRRRGRWSAHRPPAAHPRVRGGLAVARRGLAGPTGDRRRIGRRCTPRHDVRRHLFHIHAGRRGAGRGLLSWQQAVRLLTDVPARLYGLRDRGRLEVGAFADVVVFDPATIGHGTVRTRDDLPGGASRLYADAVGVRHVLVNGTEIVREGEFTGAVPGSVLRSGRDTDTVHTGSNWAGVPA